MLIINSKKGGRRRGRQGRQGIRWKLILRRGTEDGQEPNQGRWNRLPGLLTSIDGNYPFYITTK